MKKFIKNESFSGEGFVHIYAAISKEEFGLQIDKIMQSSGYKIKEGEIGAATYEKGNRTLRILFGAFVKYFKFTVLIKSENSDEVKVEVIKASTGMSGGLIGISQVKNELKRMADILHTI